MGLNCGDSLGREGVETPDLSFLHRERAMSGDINSWFFYCSAPRQLGKASYVGCLELACGLTNVWEWRWRAGAVRHLSMGNDLAWYRGFPPNMRECEERHRTENRKMSLECWLGVQRCGPKVCTSQELPSTVILIRPGCPYHHQNLYGSCGISVVIVSSWIVYSIAYFKSRRRSQILQIWVHFCN